MRNLILAAVAAVSLAGCPQQAKTASSQSEYRPETVVVIITEPDGKVRKFITFRPEIALGARCTYEFGYIGPIQPTCYGY